MNIKNDILNYKDQMISDLQKLVKYNSVLDTTSNYPFGEENAKCLDEALSMLDAYGFKTKNLDYYAGYGEVGTGEELIGILGHLDIVPATGDWKSDPFTLDLRDGKLFGRGTSDDKGPLIAAIYALRVLMDNNVTFNKRIRIIAGSNEETGSKCLAHYVEKEGHIDYGFTPDADFPGIHGEKGIIHCLNKGPKTKIIDIEGGVAANVVCNKVKVTLKASDINLVKFEEYCKLSDVAYEINHDGDNVILDVHGVAGHASRPTTGKNAIAYLMQALHFADFEDEYVNYFNSYIGLTTDGSLANINFTDEYGVLTMSIGVIKKEGDHIVITIDIRYPVTIDGSDVIRNLENNFNKEGEIYDLSDHKPLFFAPDHPMIQALVKAYQDVTNDLESKPTVIGGGTYSKGINNCIAFGGDFNDEPTMIHDANEFIKVENLLKQAEVYAHAILNLLEI